MKRGGCSPRATMSYLIDGVDREDEALVGQEEVHVMFVNYSPDIVQPASDALDGLFEELVAVRALSDERPLGVAVELIEEAIYLALL